MCLSPQGSTNIICNLKLCCKDLNHISFPCFRNCSTSTAGDLRKNSSPASAKRPRRRKKKTFEQSVSFLNRQSTSSSYLIPRCELSCIHAYWFFGSRGSDTGLKLYTLFGIRPCGLVIHAQKIHVNCFLYSYTMFSKEEVRARSARAERF